MFSNLFNNAINAVKSFLNNKPAAKPAPKPTPKPSPSKGHVIQLPQIRPTDTFAKFEPLTKIDWYIPSLYDSPTTRATRQAKHDASWQAHQDQIKRQAEEDARAEAARRKWVAQQKFDKTKNEYAGKARKLAEDAKKNNQGSLWSKITGGFTGENETRDFAQKQLEKLKTEQTARYDTKLNNFLAIQAARKADIEKKKFASREEFDKAVGIFTKWEEEQIADLEYTRAASAGLADAWQKESEKKGTSWLAKSGTWFNDKIIQPVADNAIFKYTLGAGDENLPSLVTAPARGANWLGNMFNNDGNKNLSNNTWVKGYEPGKNAWTQTFNQRNFNMALPEKYSDEKFEQWYKTRDLSQWKEDIDKGRLDKEKVKEKFRDLYKSQMSSDETANNVSEFFADPLALIPTAKISSGANKWLSWAKRTAGSTEKGSAFFEAADKIAQSKPIKGLWSEYKTPEQRFSDAYKQAKSGTDELQQRLAPRIDAINARLAGGDKIDTSILDEFAKLTDHEAAILQRMVNGKFSLRDSIALRDIKGLRGGMGAQREKLMSLASRWDDFSEKMKLADEVNTTRFGKGKRFYSPRIDYTKDDALETYDFKAKKLVPTHKNPQSATDLARNARERYILSDSGRIEMSGLSAERARWASRRDELMGEYKTKSNELRSEVRAADKQRGTIGRYVSQRRQGVDPTTGLGRSLFNSGRKVAGVPVKAWKKSVLALRPAWTVNNVLYNTQAAALAGGAGALAEHAKMLRPKNWRKAMDEVPDNVKADLTGELGGSYSGRNPFKKIDSKLTNMYSNIENTPRVAAFRALKAKGLTDEQALKRVDKYMFNYKTKNWERPLKSVMPFWSWSKSLSKAAATMPFDRPYAAKAYHEVDEYQNEQFDREFEAVVPELTKLGFSEEEIQQIKTDQAKYYRGRLKVGDKWITTPFNAFSEKGLTGVGFNPYLAATGESGSATDSFGRQLNGTEALWKNRVLSKFPQYELGKQSLSALRVAQGADKPKEGWIGAAGSEGYGLTKERQGFDTKAANYDRNLDPRAKLGQNAMAFLGVPRGLDFDKDKLIESKKLQKATRAYFDLDTKEMQFDEAEAARQGVFTKYGITAEEFYGGVLSKYDTENTKRIKGMKETARTANKKLFEEYAAQPAGTRNLWATKKLRELNDRDYFADNPFKKSFKYITPDTVAKADKQELVKKAMATGDWSDYQKKFGKTQKQKDYEYASSTGDWSKWRKQYGTTSQKARDFDHASSTGDWSTWESKYGKTEKAAARDRAIKSGDWSEYAKMYGVSTKKTPHQYDGKFFKSAESMAKYKEGQFWETYAESSKEERRTLLEKNPQYNRRKDWTDEMWDEWKTTKKAAETAKLANWRNGKDLLEKNRTSNNAGAAKFIAKKKAGRSKSVWRLTA